MAQRQKIATMIDKAQKLLHDAAQENAPIWLSVELNAINKELEIIQTRLLMVK